MEALSLNGIDGEPRSIPTPVGPQATRDPDALDVYIWTSVQNLP